VEVIEFKLEDCEPRQRYDLLFEACPHAFIQQSTYWAEVIQDLGPDRPIFLLAQEEGEALAGLPLYLYHGSAGSALISIPHPGPLGGIFARENTPDSTLDRLYAALIKRAVQIAEANHCLGLTFITNPFQDDLHLYQKHLHPTLTYENFTQYIDLKQMVGSDGSISLRDYNRRSNLSRNLRRARDAGFTVGPVDGEADLRALYDVQARRHAELGVPPLEYQLFENVYRYLVPRNKALFLLVKQGNDIASGCIYVYHRQVLDVLRLSLNSQFTRHAPNFLNTDYSLRWARQQSVETYNWQSSPSRDSGVYYYKQQWGSATIPYYFVSRLFCEPDTIRAIGLQRLQTEYAGHFIVPYAVFDQGFDQALYKK
jgi:hypothetical protein